LIKKIKILFVRKYKQWKVILTTKKNKLTKQTDLKRWSSQKALFSSWDERTQLLANKIKPNKTVFEFGAARLVLKEMLPDGSIYLHSDLVRRAEDTLVVDLNKELPILPQVDYIVFSGVLEYLFDIEKVLLHLNPKTSCFLFSYATVDNFSNISERREHGWVSDLSVCNLETIAIKLDKKLVHFGSWKSQHLFILN
jgi:hypothetical protein